MITVIVQGFMKAERIINPKMLYASVMYAKRVYESEMYS